MDCPDSFYFIWIVFGLSGQFLDYPDSLMFVRRDSKSLGQSLDYPDSFLANQPVFSEYMASFNSVLDLCKTFPGSNATTLPWLF